MKNRFIVIYTIFAAAVFIFSVTFFGFNLYKEYSTNLEKSELKFTELVNDIRTLSYAQDENTPAYAQGIKNAVGDAADYSFIQVRRNNETVPSHVPAIMTSSSRRPRVVIACSTLT